MQSCSPAVRPVREVPIPGVRTALVWASSLVDSTKDRKNSDRRRKGKGKGETEGRGEKSDKGEKGRTAARVGRLCCNSHGALFPVRLENFIDLDLALVWTKLTSHSADV